MLAHIFRRVTKTPHTETPISAPISPLIAGTEQAIDAAAYKLVEEMRAYAKAHPEHGIPAGQRLLAAQHLAYRSITALLVGAHIELDDVFGRTGKKRSERKRDVLMAQLTTYFIPALLDATADWSVQCELPIPEVREAVAQDVDSLFDYALKTADKAAHDATRDV